MRSQALAVVAGLVSIFIGVHAAPALSYGNCVDVSTVTVTASQPTVYVKVAPATSSAATTSATVTFTSTHHSTFYLTSVAHTSTVIVPSSAASALGTSVILQSSQNLSFGSEDDGPCYFYYDEAHSITSYINCPAPTTTDASLVLKTTTFVVVPTPVASLSDADHASTLTLRSTIQSTTHLALTSTITSSTSSILTTSSSTSLTSATSTPFSLLAVTSTTIPELSSVADNLSLTQPTQTPSISASFINSVQGAGLPYTGYGFGGWNGTSSTSNPIATGNAGPDTPGHNIASPLNGTQFSGTASSRELVTSLATFNIYSHRPTLTLSTLKAASGFHYSQSSSLSSHVNTTGVYLTLSSTISITSTVRGVSTTVMNDNYTFSGVHDQTVSLTSIPIAPSISNVGTLSYSSTYPRESTTNSITNLEAGTLPSSSLVPPAIESITSVSIFSHGDPLISISSFNTPITPSTTPSISSSTASISSSATNLSSGLLPLGAQCDNSSQCAYGASCYAVNSMLNTLCGNFQASCTCDLECAFNTCVEGYCSGQVKSSTIISKSVVMSPSPSTTTALAYQSVIPVPAFTSQPGGFSNVSQATSEVYFGSISTLETSTRTTARPIQSSNVSSAATALPTTELCGERGDFVLNFDDIPPLQSGNNSNIHSAPVFNPYHQFDFSDGFTVVPPPTDPYLPSSKPLLLEFIPSHNDNRTNPQPGTVPATHKFSGQISDGDHALTGCFLFNFYGASFGCDSRGPNCDFIFSGYKYDIDTGNETLIAAQSLAVPACPLLSSCALTPVTLTTDFQNLTHIRVNATVASVPKMWWMDDLRLGWFDNSCKTGLCRQNAHIH